jgi:hypothetical protein
VPFGTYDVHHGCTRTRSLLIYLFQACLSKEQFQDDLNTHGKLHLRMSLTVIESAKAPGSRCVRESWVPSGDFETMEAVNSDADFLPRHAAQICPQGFTLSTLKQVQTRVLE